MTKTEIFLQIIILIIIMIMIMIMTIIITLLIPIEKLINQRDSFRKAREAHLIEKAQTLEINKRDG